MRISTINQAIEKCLFRTLKRISFITSLIHGWRGIKYYVPSEERDAHRFVEIAFHSRVKESLDPMAIDPLPLCSACVVAVAIEVNGFLPIGTYRHDLLQFLTIQIHEPTNKSQSNPTRIFPRKTGSDSGLCASTFPYAIIYIVFGCSLFSPFGHSLYM